MFFVRWLRLAHFLFEKGEKGYEVLYELRSRGDRFFLLRVWEKIQENIPAPAKETEEVIDKLYTLRAGLSHISKKYDEYKTLIEDFGKKKEIELENARRYEELKWEYERCKAEARNAVDPEKFTKELKDCEAKVKEGHKKRRLADGIKCASWVFLIVSFMALIVSSAIGIIDVVWMLIACFACAVLSFVGLKISRATKSHATSLINLGSQIPKMRATQAESYSAACRIDSCREEIMQYQKIVSVKMNESEYVGKMVNCLETSQSLYEMLKSNFGTIVSPTDWMDLDIIIYLFETNRVTSIQEALQQLDLIKRHEEIKAVMIEVGDRICSTIRTCTNRLSYQMDLIASHLKDINNNIISTADMQRSLLEKANETSKKLSQDVHKMRDYADIYAKQNNLTI